MINSIIMRSLRGLLVFSIFIFSINCGNQSANEESIEDDANLTNTESEINKDSKIILVFGDSLAAGYGLELSEAFPAHLQNRIDAENLDYSVVNAGLSGETTASGKSRIDWILQQNVDIFILELGANDGLRGIPLAETKQNLQDIIDKVKLKNPDVKVIIAGMQIPPNMGQDYTSKFKDIFPKLAEDNKAKLIPFLLDGVAGIPELNQSDGIHPTAEGNKIVADNVWGILEKELEK